MPVIFTRNMISPNTTAHPVPEPPPQPRGGGMEMSRTRDIASPHGNTQDAWAHLPPRQADVK